MKKSKKDHNILKNQNFWLSVFLVLIISFGYYLYFQDKTEFIIYKQECEEKIQHQFRCSDGTYYIDTIGCFENLIFFNTKEGLECLSNEKIVNDCETKEVDEIEILNNCFFLPSGQGVGCEGTCEPTKAYCDEKGCKVCYISKISKQDLSIEWLENNCDVCHDYICISKSENTNISVIEFANKELKFYQCGNYTVKLK